MPDPVGDSDCVLCEETSDEIVRQKGLCEANITANADFVTARIAALKAEEKDIVAQDGVRQKTAETKKQEIKKLQAENDELHRAVKEAIPGTLPGAGKSLLNLRHDSSKLSSKKDPPQPVGATLDVVAKPEDAPPAERPYEQSFDGSSKASTKHLEKPSSAEVGEDPHPAGASIDVVANLDDAPPVENPYEQELDSFGAKVKPEPAPAKPEPAPADEEVGSIDVATVQTTTANPGDLVGRWLRCDKKRGSAQLDLNGCKKRSAAEATRRKARVAQFERSVASRKEAGEATRKQHEVLDKALKKAQDSNVRTAAGLKDMGGV